MQYRSKQAPYTIQSNTYFNFNKLDFHSQIESKGAHDALHNLLYLSQIL